MDIFKVMKWVCLKLALLAVSVWGTHLNVKILEYCLHCEVTEGDVSCGRTDKLLQNIML